MYKKRFARWGFHKNARRPRTAMERATSAAARSSSVDRCVPAPPSLGSQDALALLLLTSVKTWSASFFEAPPQVVRCPGPAKVKEISFAFKLVVDLLDRGRGDLAGRMARKAFLLVEDMLQALAAPALVWNMLEIMHHMVSLRQARLFQMLLAHVLALVGRQPHRAGGHPLLAVLHSLRGAAAAASTEDDASGGNLRHLLAQAWTLNAEILFASFHPDLFYLYCCIMWESCSVGPPATIVGSASQWLRTIDAVQTSSQPAQALPDDAGPSPPQPRPQQQQRPADYARLHASSLAVLRAHGEALLRDGGAGFQGDGTLALRVLAGLTTAKILQHTPEKNERLVLRPDIGLGSVACVIRTLVDIDAAERGVTLSARSGSSTAIRASFDMDAVEQIRAVVDLRTQSGGATHPQVVRDMWLLQDALGAAGDAAAALRVEQDTYARIEQYVCDIPVDAV